MITRKKLSPFLRWAGGKVYIIHKLIHYVPEDYAKRTYIEPFLGGGSMFFTLCPQRAILSDMNHHLIHCYKSLRDYPRRVYSFLKIFIERDSEEFFYQIREEYNRSRFSAKQAARFIYLNRTCFNGIFRVNEKDKFNVPYGKKKNPVFPALVELMEISKSLKKARLRMCSYEKALSHTKEGDFIYLDPPYPPLNGTSFFTHYTKERFYEEDQVNLSKTASQVAERGCLVMISNADTPLIRHLYKHWNINKLNVTRWITCKAQKHKVDELVITNY
jgi:DNA adenine methylase